MSWNGYDDLLVATLPVEFRFLDIERYTGFPYPLEVVQSCYARAPIRSNTDDHVVSLVTDWCYSALVRFTRPLIM